MIRRVPKSLLAPALLMATHGVSIALWAAGVLSLPLMVLVLLAASTGLALKVSADRDSALLMIGATLILGPLAGPVLLILNFPATATRRTAVSEVSRSESAADRVIQQIESGRRYLDRSAPPRSFVEIFETGSLAEQQAALSALARSYGPELRPALDKAMASDIPAVRVQAAAAFAVLRDRYAARLRVLPTLDPDLIPAEEAALRASGFVDPAAIDAMALPAPIRPADRHMTPPAAGRRELAA